MFKKRIPLINRGLDAYAMRQRVISKNIANATSPHYRPEMVRFEEFFHNPEVVLSGTRTNKFDIPLGKKSDSEIQGEFANAPVPAPEIYFAGESHVNIDKEMTKLAENQIRFRFASRAMKAYFSRFQTAIVGRVK